MRKIIVYIAIVLAVMSSCFAISCSDSDTSKEAEGKIELEQTSIELDLYEIEELHATLNGVSGSIKWLSSDESVCKVYNGKVVPVSEGNVTITAKVGDYSDKCNVSIINSGETPSFDIGLESTSLFKGSSKTINPIVRYKGAKYSDVNITLQTNDGGVASVVNNKINAINKGTTDVVANLTWRGYNDQKTVSVNVKEIVTFAFEDSKIKLYTIDNVGQDLYKHTQQLLPVVNIDGQDLLDIEVSYEIDNNEIASVSENGLITGLDVGSTFITAKYLRDDEEYEATVQVKVLCPVIDSGEQSYLSLAGTKIILDISKFKSLDSNEILKVFDKNYSILSTENVDGKFELSGVNGKVGENGELYLYNLDKIAYKLNVSYVTKAISDKADLFEMRKIAEAQNFEGYYILENDVDLEDDTWSPWCAYYVDGIAKGYAFKGTFDGNGYAIKNAKFTYDSDGQYAFKGNGFIGRLSSSGVIKNVSFIDCKAVSKAGLYGVIVCGQNDGLIENVFVKMPASNFIKDGSTNYESYVFSTDEHSGSISNCFAIIEGEKNANVNHIYGATTKTTNTNVNIIGNITPVEEIDGYEDNGGLVVYKSLEDFNLSSAKNNYDLSIWNILGDYPILIKKD